MIGAKIPDPAEGKIEPHKQKYIKGWTIDKWIAFIKRNPECTLPSGVGHRLVQLIESSAMNNERSLNNISV